MKTLRASLPSTGICLLVIILAGTTAPAAITDDRNASPTRGSTRDFYEAAQMELEVTAKKRETAPRPLSASTVNLSLHTPPPPERSLFLRPSLWFQLYQPLGRIRPAGLSPYALDNLAPYPLFSGRLDWSPWVANPTLGSPTLGVAATLGTGLTSLQVYSPTGYDFGATYLHHFDSQFALQAEWQLAQAPQWYLSLQLGAGRVDLIQASASSLLNMSGSASYVHLEAGARWAFRPPLSAHFNLQWRSGKNDPTDGDFSIGIPGQSLLLGVSGEL